MDKLGKNIKINQKSWEDRTSIHLKSKFYDLEAFKKNPMSLKSFELEGLGDVKGKSLLHLQCHFGQDSLSMARMGAKVTGVDLSEKAIEQANNLNQQLQLDAEFYCSNILIYQDQKEAFDIVFASYGVLGWHPDISAWFKVASQLLKPGGELFW